MGTVKTFVLDTNVILHDSKCLFSFKENDVAIPIEVIMELDPHKKGEDSISYHAREALRTIEGMPQIKVHDGGALLGEGLGKLRVISLPYHNKVKKIFSEQTMDHRILNAAYCLLNDGKSKGVKNDVIFVSKDVNLRIKAGALGITAEDYTTDAVPEAETFYAPSKTIEVTSEIISSLYKDKFTSFDKNDFNLKENESVTVDSNSSGSTALAFYKEGNLHLINKKEMRPLGIEARNSEQAFALNLLLDPNISSMTLAGPAGTGKTLLTLAAAYYLVKTGLYDRIYYTRKVIGLTDNDLGFLPGDANEKISPYMQGFFDNMLVLKSLNGNEALIKKIYETEKKVTLEPLAFIRGRSIPKAFFILDETQNDTAAEVKAILTRAGVGTKMVLLGDPTQIDSPYLSQSSNGLTHFISRFNGEKTYGHVSLVKGERSDLAELAARLL